VRCRRPFFHMRRLYRSSVFLAVLVCSVAVSRSKGQSDGVDKIILHDFPGFHVLTVEERDSDTRAFILAHFAKRNPSILHADFDGDGHLDYAVLLKDKKSGIARFVILLCPETEHCKKACDEDITSSAREVFLRPVPIGRRVSQTDAIDTKDYPPPVRLSSTGIEVTYFGQAKVVYYWNGKHKKMETVQTED
jgi:hypothetical protein